MLIRQTPGVLELILVVGELEGWVGTTVGGSESLVGLGGSIWVKLERPSTLLAVGRRRGAAATAAIIALGIGFVVGLVSLHSNTQRDIFTDTMSKSSEIYTYICQGQTRFTLDCVDDV